MLKIIVKGSGLIPRGHGIAPRTTPFEADKKLIYLILVTDNLDPYFLNPDTKKFVKLTKANYEKMYDMYGNKAVKKVIMADKAPMAEQVKSAITQAPTVTQQPEAKQEEAKEEPKTDLVIAPINNPNTDDKSNHNNKKR